MKKRNGGTTGPKRNSFKIKLRGRDNAPLSMAEIRLDLYEIVHKPARYEPYRAKWVTLYLTLVDENGSEVRMNGKGEWTIHPYKSAADELGA